MCTAFRLINLKGATVLVDRFAGELVDQMLV